MLASIRLLIKHELIVFNVRDHPYAFPQFFSHWCLYWYIARPSDQLVNALVSYRPYAFTVVLLAISWNQHLLIMHVCINQHAYKYVTIDSLVK